MKLDQKQLTEQEEFIIDLLKVPYGIEKTSSDMVRDSQGILIAGGLISVLEDLEQRGYLKSRYVTPDGYLVGRRMFSINHIRIHKESRLRLQTRLEIERLCNFKIAA